MSSERRMSPALSGGRPRRNAELFLLVFAVAIVVAAEAVVEATRDGRFSHHLLTYAAVPVVVAVITHLVIRKVAPYADPLLLPIAVLLNGLGLVLIYRLDQVPSLGPRAAPAQLVWSATGVALFTVVVLVLRDHRLLARYTFVSGTLAVALLVVPILFPPVNGARIWVRLAGFSFQPGEFAKVLLAVFFAGYLSANRAALAYTGRRVPLPRRLPALYRVPLLRRLGRVQLPTGRVLGPVLAIWLVSVGVLVLERDLGTSLLFFCLFVVMLYVATGRTGWIAVGLLLASVGVLATGGLEPHVHSRVTDWLHPFASIGAGQGPGQLAQSLFSFAGGGFFGAGLGQGYSGAIGFAAKSDFVLATAGEETGLAGLAALLALYALLVGRGFTTALRLRDPFGRLLAAGLASILALQVFVITGGVMDLIPLTGMAMPFLAQGGSSVVANWIIVALLIRASDHANRPRDEAARIPGPPRVREVPA